MTPCCGRLELLDHIVRPQEIAVRGFPRLDTGILCSEEHVDSGVMVAYYVVVGWW